MCLAQGPQCRDVGEEGRTEDPYNTKRRPSSVMTFDLLTPSPGWRGGVCGQNICYNVAAFLIPFNLICNMTVFLKSEHNIICYHVSAFVITFNLICIMWGGGGGGGGGG